MARPCAESERGEVMNIAPITAAGQIKEGDVLLVKRSNEFIAPVTVKLVLNPGSNHEEIVLAKGKNIYFITSMFLDGKSWVKECCKLENGKIYSISNSLHNFSTYE